MLRISKPRAWALIAFLALLELTNAPSALATKEGGVLKIYHRGTPPSGSIHEEATITTVAPYMAVFNNLVIYDQHEPRNSIAAIVPDLATAWSWNFRNTELTFTLRPDVRWHDGAPFTSRDVKCTWDLLLETGAPRLRRNPRKAWYHNLDRVSTAGDSVVTFHLRRPQPAFIALLASGYSPVYPCHVPPQRMRTHPIGTGPFKFVELKQNERVVLRKNNGYWKDGRPHLDGIEWTIIKSRSARVLSFVAGRFDMTFAYDLTIPLLADVRQQLPHAVCELRSTNVSVNLIVNRDRPPFDNPMIRSAMALTLDRKAFIKALSAGQYLMGGTMMPPPAGLWGLPRELLATVPGYGPDTGRNREEAREIMRGFGYGPDNPLKIALAVRNIASFREPAVILIDQLKEIFIQAELDRIETSRWFAKVMRKDYTVGLNLTGSAVDDPDAHFYENYSCGSSRNYTGYCNAEIEALLHEQSVETDQKVRRKLVWEIDRKLQEDGARPIIFHGKAATCWQPYVKNFTTMQNSIYNGWRLEDLWLDR